MRKRWTDNPETGKDNDSIPWREIKGEIEEIIAKQVSGSKPADVGPAAHIILATLAHHFKMIPEDLFNFFIVTAKSETSPQKENRIAVFGSINDVIRTIGDVEKIGLKGGHYGLVIHFEGGEETSHGRVVLNYTAATEGLIHIKWQDKALKSALYREM